MLKLDPVTNSRVAAPHPPECGCKARDRAATPIWRLLLRAPFMALIQAYRLFISPWLGPRCRFYPSCSEYALNALTQLPLHRALLLTTKRILKCQPFCSGGYDPVPKR